jgi:repressor LexA
LYKNFKKLLEERNISAYRVGKDTGIAQSTLSDWKTGKSTPKLDKLITIANYFSVPIERLIEGDD